MRVAVIGFGTVGTGVVRLLLEPGRFAGLPDAPSLHSVYDTDLVSDRGLRLPPTVPLRADAGIAINDPSVDIVVELIGGVVAAYQLMRRALEAGKPVVTANKALLAERGRELFRLARDKGLSIGFEASVCGGVPIMRALRSGLAAERIGSFMGVVNGTCNYVLTRMYDEGIGYQEALAAARAAGYAEADPMLDVSGTDSAHKLVLLAAVAFGRMPQLDDVYIEGISRLEAADVAYARGLGYATKLLAIGARDGEAMQLRVHPALLRDGHPLASVAGPYNAVFVHSDAVGTTMFYGAGAGGMPTASAVLSDILDIASGTAAAEFARLGFIAAEPAKVLPFDEVETRYYLRFTVQDRFGVLGRIAGVLGDNRVSIDSVVQKEARGKERVPIVMLTHRAREKDVRRAIATIDRADFVSAPTALIRVEGE